MTGRDLRTMRRKAGVTQMNLAAHLGCTQQAISAIERRTEVRPQTVDRHLRAIAELVSGRHLV